MVGVPVMAPVPELIESPEGSPLADHVAMVAVDEVSVAELDDASLWNRATLGVVAISGSTDYLTGQMREVDDALGRLCNGLGAEILDSWVELLGE